MLELQKCHSTHSFLSFDVSVKRERSPSMTMVGMCFSRACRACLSCTIRAAFLKANMADMYIKVLLQWEHQHSSGSDRKAR